MYLYYPSSSVIFRVRDKIDYNSFALDVTIVEAVLYSFKIMYVMQTTEIQKELEESSDFR